VVARWPRGCCFLRWLLYISHRPLPAIPARTLQCAMWCRLRCYVGKAVRMCGQCVTSLPVCIWARISKTNRYVIIMHQVSARGPKGARRRWAVRCAMHSSYVARRTTPGARGRSGYPLPLPAKYKKIAPKASLISDLIIQISLF
jgi:hypothetical protein